MTNQGATAIDQRNIHICIHIHISCSSTSWKGSWLVGFPAIFTGSSAAKSFLFLNINQFGYKCSFDPKSEPAATHKGENAHKITFHASKKLNKNKNKTSLQETCNENENKTWKKLGSDVSMHFATFHRPPSVHKFLPKLDK